MNTNSKRPARSMKRRCSLGICVALLWSLTPNALAAKPASTLRPGAPARSPATVIYKVVEIAPFEGNGFKPYNLGPGGELTGGVQTDNFIAAAVWRSGVVENLDPGSGYSTALDINDSGQAVGTANFDATEHAYLLPDRRLTDLDPVHLVGCQAAAINSSGKVAGNCAIFDEVDRQTHWHAVIWDTTVSGNPVQMLAGLPGDPDSLATGIDDAGVVVGESGHDFAIGGSGRAVAWKDGAIMDLGAGTYSIAMGMNGTGWVTGSYYPSYPDHSSYFLWHDDNDNGASDPGELRDAYDYFPGGGGYGAPQINDSGHIVWGTRIYHDDNGNGAPDPEETQDLNSLLGDPSYTLAGLTFSYINNHGQILTSALDPDGLAKFVLLDPPPRPVLIIPGIGATYSADTVHDLDWLLHRGVAPTEMQIDPMTKVYDDLIQTLQNVGYVLGKDLFVVNYDWRLPPGPDDGNIDGHIDGLTAASISDQHYLYAVDYLGDVLRQAAEQWTIDNPDLPPLDAVDVITHSTGGLVARTYVQSDAYGGVYGAGKSLPTIENLFMIGVPNRGASKAWNPLQDNWVVDPAFQAVLSKIVNRAYQKVLTGTQVVGGPDYNINLASITQPHSNPDCHDSREVCFINQYIPTARALLATYDFLNCTGPIPDVACGNGYTNLNGNPELRNTLLLDLNAGLDGDPVGDPNAFADQVAKLIVIYGTNGGAGGGVTPRFAEERVGPGGLSGTIANFDEFSARDAAPSEIWFRDIVQRASGDGTVPLDSSRDQFVGDPRANISLMPFKRGGNTSADVSHTALPYNIDVQRAILHKLGRVFDDPVDISTDKNGFGAGAIQCAATCSNWGLDPVEGFMVDAQGRRLGFSTATGPLTEIPNSVWVGDADGMGWVFGPVEEPLTAELTGLGEDYYVMAGVAGRTGVVDQGSLATGEPKEVPLPPSPNRGLTVTLEGTGGGSVASVQAEIDCGDTCAANFDTGSAVALVATANGDSTFTGWSGDCTDTGACDLAMNHDRYVTATFADTTAPTLTCPANIAVENMTPEGAFVSWPDAAATDASDPSPKVTYSQIPGVFFPIGMTTVTATATDVAGNAGTCDFTVNVIGPDTDGDSVSDAVDNCLLVANADQRDADGDGIGSMCDADFDNSCYVNFEDLGMMKAAFFTTDPNTNMDGRGTVNFVDLGLLKKSFFQQPGPSGIPNVCDDFGGG